MNSFSAYLTLLTGLLLGIWLDTSAPVSQKASEGYALIAIGLLVTGWWLLVTGRKQ